VKFLASVLCVLIPLGAPPSAPNNEASRASDASVSQAPTVADRVVHDLCNARVALLGESRTHGFGNTMAFKAEIARRLIDECHFNAFLIESGTYDFVKIRRDVRARRPLTDAMVAAAIGGLWANGDVEPLIPFLTAKAQQGSIVLGGLDDQLGRGTYAQLQMPGDLVESLPENDRERCRAVLQRHTLWQYTNEQPYGPPDKARILACLEEVAGNVRRQHDANVRDDDSVMVASLQRLFARDFDEGTVAGVDANTRAFTNRDRSMYENFRWWMSRLPAGSKVIVWTATVHAAKISVPGQERFVPLGFYIARDFGHEAFVLGISALAGTSGMMRQPVRPLPPAPDSSLEARAFALPGSDSRYLDRATLRAAGSAPSRVLGMDFTTTVWADVIDGLVVLRDERPPKSLGNPAR
jgi:erythromycin esterase-like protein